MSRRAQIETQYDQQSSVMLLVVRWINYDYLEECYRRFCRRSTVKHLRLVTCNSLNGSITVFLFLPSNSRSTARQLRWVTWRLAYWSIISFLSRPPNTRTFHNRPLHSETPRVITEFAVVRCLGILRFYCRFDGNHNFGMSSTTRYPTVVRHLYENYKADFCQRLDVILMSNCASDSHVDLFVNQPLHIQLQVQLPGVLDRGTMASQWLSAEIGL